MRTIWTVIAFFALVGLSVAMFFDNMPDVWYNLFHKNKRPICWDPMAFGRSEMDDTEAFYHD